MIRFDEIVVEDSEGPRGEKVRRASLHLALEIAGIPPDGPLSAWAHTAEPPLTPYALRCQIWNSVYHGILPAVRKLMAACESGHYDAEKRAYDELVALISPPPPPESP